MIAKDLLTTTRRDLLIGSMGMACAGSSVVLGRDASKVPPLPENALESVLPAVIGDWRAIPAAAVVLPSEGSLSDRLYSEVVTRAFQRAEVIITLLLAYGAVQSGSMQLHRPELCYPAAGFAIKSSRAALVPLDRGREILVTLLDTESSVRREQVLYWTRVGNEFPTSRMAQRWVVLRENLSGHIPDGMLVRVSVSCKDSTTAFAILKSFVASMVQNVDGSAQKLLFG